MGTEWHLRELTLKRERLIQLCLLCTFLYAFLFFPRLGPVYQKIQQYAEIP